MTSLTTRGTEMLHAAGLEAAAYLGVRQESRIMQVREQDSELEERIFVLADGWGLSLDGDRFWMFDDHSWRVFSFRSIDEEHARGFMMLLLAAVP